MGWRVFGGAWILLFLLSGAWVMATPISAAPDEPAHIVKAASVVRGQFVGEPSEWGQIVQVPQYIASTHAQTCFAFHPQQSAACSPPVTGDPWQTVDGSTTAGLYNPMYYAIVGWPSLVFQDGSGIYAMRLVNALVCSLFLALCFALVSRWPRPGLAYLGLAVAITPMVLFLGATINPNSLETVTVLAAFVGILSIVLHPRPELLTPRAVVALVSAAVAVNTRGLSPVWVAIAVLAPFVLANGRQVLGLLRRNVVRVAIGVVAVATALALLWLVRSNSLTAAVDDPSDALTAPAVGASPIVGFVTTLERTFGLGQNMIGVFGWLDTSAPLAVFFVWSAFIGILAILALVLLRGRMLALAITLIAAVLLVPPVIQGLYITGGGFIWQGRYTLPIFVCLVFALAALLADRLPLIDRVTRSRLAGVMLGLWAAGQLYSFVIALKRYAVGSDGTWAEFALRPQWTPPGGVLFWSAAMVVFVCAAAFLLYRRVIASDVRELTR